MKKIGLLIFMGFLFCNWLFSQSEPTSIKYFKKTYSNNIIIHQENSVTDYLELYSKLGRQKALMGYRIKIYSQNTAVARTQSNSVKSTFETQFPEQKAYKEYADPNFEVCVGDFINRFDAVIFLQKIISKYPNAYIVKTTINIDNGNE